MTKLITIDLIETRNELSELIKRARFVDYKNIQPKLPTRVTESSMMGFTKRLYNWTNGLKQLESSSDEKLSLVGSV